MGLFETVSTASSMMATAVRCGRGIYTRPAPFKPEKLLELYEFESCPSCRLIREVLTELDLDALIYPCPKRGTRFRPRVIELGGKTQFPFLVDPNTGRQMYESADIIAYLFKTYGQRPVPVTWRVRILNIISSRLATASRCGAGTPARASNGADQPLELYSLESSPFARLARETLCELELAYVLRSLGRTQLAESLPPPVRERLNANVGAETSNRKQLLERAGKVMTPYLIDPNTGTEMFESRAIQRYLRATYAAKSGAHKFA